MGKHDRYIINAKRVIYKEWLRAAWLFYFTESLSDISPYLPEESMGSELVHDMPLCSLDRYKKMKQNSLLSVLPTMEGQFLKKRLPYIDSSAV